MAVVGGGGGGGGGGGRWYLLSGLSFPKIVTINILNNVCMHVKLYLMTLAPSANAGFRGGRFNI